MAACSESLCKQAGNPGVSTYEPFGTFKRHQTFLEDILLQRDPTFFSIIRKLD
jgi:hypothetical protein